MSNWTGMSRTNYVTIEDPEGLKKSLELFDTDLNISNDYQGSEKVCFISNTEYGEWPHWVFSEELDDDVEFSAAEHIMPFVKEGEVLVIMEAGHEKARYITGNATAFIRRGDSVEETNVNLHDIYEKAVKNFNIPMTKITNATY